MDFLDRLTAIRDKIIEKDGATKVNMNSTDIDYLENCKVYLLDVSNNLTIKNCKNTKLVITAVKGTIFIENCFSCEIHLVANKMILTGVKDSEIFVYLTRTPVTSGCSNVTFAPCDLRYPYLRAQA